VVEDLIADRVTRDLTRDHCALLELVAIPEAGGSLITNTQPTLKRRIEPVHLYERTH